jgi:hypothetical protein
MGTLKCFVFYYNFIGISHEMMKVIIEKVTIKKPFITV